ncbi:DUF883 family protein [Rhizobium sp. P32RR-XVIII]|nr:DUF883 family protein [Rhizobium sp. P32RR-XVIII]NLS06539.1 DUF883 family protein [Rhizobium sp. P32RR-XVIII]
MMASLFHSARGRSGNGTLHDIESTIEDQIESLRDEIATLTKLVSKNTRRYGDRSRYQAAAGYDELIARGEDLLRDLQEGYTRGATEVRDTVRSHPVAAIGTAAAVALVLAFLVRR